MTQDHAMYVISIAAELAGVHPQTLRVYERKGLVQPARTEGNTRRYSDRDIERLRKIQELTHAGVNLAGVERIIELESELEVLRVELERLHNQIFEAMDAAQRQALVPLRDVRRVRRAMKADLIDRAGQRRTFPSPPISGTDENEG
jgi:MerR family transcriptional regulator/heat shock protein HspR